MTEYPPNGFQAVIPFLTYDDAPGAIAFLCKAFGFEERHRLTMDDGRIGYAELAFGGSALMVGSAFPEMDLVSPKSLSGTASQFVLWVEDVDAHFSQAQEAGAAVQGEPQDQFHGARAYRAVDPEGHRWMFQQQIRVVDPKTWAD